MKRILVLLVLISFLISGSLQAQLPKNRTASTIVADALSQLPASKPREFNLLMADLVTSGEEGILQLVQMMNPAAKGNNAQVEYALSGWTNYSARYPKFRPMTASAYLKALSRTSDTYIKSFIIRQLELIGEEESVAPLAALLSNAELVDPAAQALVAIGSPSAQTALLEALTQASPAVELSLINAVGQTFNPAAETILLEKLAKSATEVSDKVLLNALSKCGSSISLVAVEKKVAAAGYQYGKSNALDAYQQLLNRIIKNGNPGEAVKPVQQLMANATRNKNFEARIAALNLMSQLPSTNPAVLVKNALKDSDKAYVNTALGLYPNPDEKLVTVAVKGLSKRNTETQEAVLYWLGNTTQEAQLPVILPYMSNKNESLRAAAIHSAAKIGGTDAVKALLNLLKSNDAGTVKLAETALLSTKAEISTGVVSVYNEASEKGKLAALSILSARKASQLSGFVMHQLKNGSAEVNKYSAQVLKNIVAEKDLPALFLLLEEKDNAFVAPVQEAIIQALSSMPAANQVATINREMKKSESKQLYYPLLTGTGNRESLALVANAYNESTGANKDAAFRALTTSTDFEAIYLLLDILRANPSAANAPQAMKAALKLISASGKTGEVQTIFLRELLSLATTNQQKTDIISRLGKAGTYQSMLVVAPYLDTTELKEVACQAIINIVLDKPQMAGTYTTTVLEKVKREVNNPDAGYQRDAIQKYLNENAKTVGFVPMFDGQSLKGWKGLVGTPLTREQMSNADLKKAQELANQEAATSWVIENGELVFTGAGKNLCTEKLYGDFEMLVDWKLYPGKEPDAGIYLRGTPQVQIWDTARIKVGAQVGSGGLYNNKVNPSKPLKVADLPVGTWNTFHIIMKGERVTVYLNGELVTDNVILENFWDRNLPIFPEEQIELQAHGSKVAYRDLYIREIPRPEPFKLPEEEAKQGFEVLFDGTNMHKWTGNTADYITEEGNIVLYPSKSHGGNLYTKDEFDNFVFRFEFQLTPGANNGLGIRTPMEGDAAYVGMELQILDNDASIYSQLEEYQYHGSVYGVIPAKRGYHKPMGEWNYQEVIANGDNIKITLNGTVILEGNIREASKNGTLDKKDHPGLLNKKGHIGFLGHGSKVKFRNIRVKRL